MRCFLALPLPDRIRDHALRIKDYMTRRGVRAKWTAPKSYHLTLLFLDEQQEPALAGLVSQLNQRFAAAPAFMLECGSPATFGRPPRILYLTWAGPGLEQFSALAYTCRECAAAAGLAIPDSVLRQEPRPHLTLARFRDREQARSLSRAGNFEHRSWHGGPDLPRLDAGTAAVKFDQVQLVKSVLTDAGARYEVLRQLGLGDAGNATGCGAVEQQPSSTRHTA
jgi:2'-5' RNA ligase